jgi:radical SAM protein with 4Fe4S-binding SPASM domain
MSTEDFEHILTEISPYTDYVYLHVKGEPLLHEKLQDILSLCEKYHMHANITTNGTLIPKKTEILYHSTALRQVNVSLHSFEHEEELSMNNQIPPSIFKELDDYINPILDYAKFMSTHTKAITALRLWNLEGEHSNSITHDKNRYVLSLLEKSFDLSIEPEKITRGIKLMERVFLNQDKRFEWPNLNVPVLSTTGFCYGLGAQAAILVDGTVVPCCLDNEGDIALGNIFSSSFSSIINTNRAQNMIQGFKNNVVVEDLCKRCGYRHRFT